MPATPDDSLPLFGSSAAVPPAPAPWVWGVSTPADQSPTHWNYPLVFLFDFPPLIDKLDWKHHLARHFGQHEVQGSASDPLPQAPFHTVSPSDVVAHQSFPLSCLSEEPDEQSANQNNDDSTFDCFLEMVEPARMTTDLAAAHDQTWDWPEVDHALENVNAAVRLVLTLPISTARQLSPQVLTEAVHRLALATLALIKPKVIWWCPAQRLVAPVRYISSKLDQDEPDPLFPAANVRLFPVSDSENQTVGKQFVFDTVGLASFFLPDFQCHYTGTQANELASVVFRWAYYLWHHGDVIGPGQTIGGLAPSDRWSCHRRLSLTRPQRPVLDVQTT